MAIASFGCAQVVVRDLVDWFEFGRSNGTLQDCPSDLRLPSNVLTTGRFPTSKTGPACGPVVASCPLALAAFVPVTHALLIDLLERVWRRAVVKLLPPFRCIGGTTGGKIDGTRLV